MSMDLLEVLERYDALIKQEGLRVLLVFQGDIPRHDGGNRVVHIRRVMSVNDRNQVVRIWTDECPSRDPILIAALATSPTRIHVHIPFTYLDPAVPRLPEGQTYLHVLCQRALHCTVAGVLAQVRKMERELVAYFEISMLSQASEALFVLTC